MALKKSHKIIAVLLLLGLIGGIVMPKIIVDAYPWDLFRGQPNYEKMDADFSMTANELFDEFDQNEKEATLKYQDKIIALTGTIESVKPVIDSQIQVVMTADNALFGGIKALMHSKYVDDPEYQEQISGLKSGMVSELKCKCVGFDMEVDLNNCFITANN